MPRFPVLSVLVVGLLGCGLGFNVHSAEEAAATVAADPAQPEGTVPPSDSVFCQGGGMSPFYGEVVHDGRFYLFGTKNAYATFQTTKEPSKNMKTMIAQGPGQKTIAVEMSKDAPQMTARLIATMRKRYDMPAAPVAATE